MLEEATTLLSRSQNSDGGWGSVAGKGSNTEATALAFWPCALWAGMTSLLRRPDSGLQSARIPMAVGRLAA